MIEGPQFVGPVESPQRALEREIIREGRDRAVRMLDKNEAAGRADNNPYANALYRKYLFPARDLIQEYLDNAGHAGRWAAHTALLKPLDPAAVAYIAMQTALVEIIGDNSKDARALGRQIGTSAYRELVLSAFEEASPDVYWEIIRGVEKRNSKDGRYRYRVVKDAANSREMTLPDWGPTGREQVGLWLVEVLRTVGLITVERQVVRKMKGIREIFQIGLSEEAMTMIADIRSLVEVTMPYHLPFIEQPQDWTAFDRGGYHTMQMKRLLPFCIDTPRANRRFYLDIYRSADLRVLRESINHLQAVRWQVNSDMLDLVRQLAKSPNLQLDEVLDHADLPKPDKPEWLTEALDRDNMTEAQAAEFKAWKRMMAERYTAIRLRESKWRGFYSATRVAERFREYPAIYFLYKADFRGRLYAVTTGVSPQGSDLQKSLLRFSEGKSLLDEDAVRWFKIHGAGRFGVDKVTFDERVKWVDDNAEHFERWAADPSGYTEWTEADCPLQFLAWCREFAAWRRDPAAFVSHLPVGLDGSCNGLQHFSAMLRDAVGGAATNLVPSDRPQDIYQRVADRVADKLAAMKETQSDRDADLLARWIKHGINRTLVKRSVMTLPYGSTRYSCAEFIIQDYLRLGKAPEFEKHQYAPAANFLSHVVWEAIGEVVIAASAAMAWLQKCAGKLIKQGEQHIRWTTPSAFPVIQVYNKMETTRVRSHLLGGVMIRVATDGDEPHVNHHKNGLSPNFVHSMDASHLALTTLACKEAGISSLAMIHDDYGTHAADVGKLFRLIRETFVEMYAKNDPLAWFRDHYDDLPAVPARGNLDIRDVLSSSYFFA